MVIDLKLFFLNEILINNWNILTPFRLLQWFLHYWEMHISENLKELCKRHMRVLPLNSMRIWAWGAAFNLLLRRVKHRNLLFTSI